MDAPTSEQIISDLANALQAALVAARHLDVNLTQAARDAGVTHAAVSRAASAVQQLRPGKE